MDDFVVLNPIYGQYFDFVNPPARATIAVGDQLPPGVDVMLSVVAERGSLPDENVDRQGLHVQSRSYWAPANIGPYSQAISVRLPAPKEKMDENQDADADADTAITTNRPKVVYIAGQIPLVPASMDMYQDQGFTGQALLSLQHLWRIGRATNVDWWTAVVGFIPDTLTDLESNVRIAQAAWRLLHAQSTNQDGPNSDEDEDEDIDPWDRMNTLSLHPAFNDETPRAKIPNRDRVSWRKPSSFNAPSQSDPIPACIIAQISSLPRAADIEWSATGLSTAHSIEFERRPPDSEAAWTRTSPSGTSSVFITEEIATSAELHDVLERLEKEVGPRGSGNVSGAVYTTPMLARGSSEDVGGQISTVLGSVQFVPCKRLWGEGGREIAGAVVVRVDG